MLEVATFDATFEFLHIPLDNYVFDIARDSLGIARPKVARSKWDNYEEKYHQYQNMIREKITTGHHFVGNSDIGKSCTKY